MLVNIDDVRPGMILAEDVLLPNGVVLLNNSHELTSSLIEMLRRRNIRAIQVINPAAIPQAQPTAPEASPEEEEPPGAFGTEAPGAEEATDATPATPCITVTISHDRMTAHLRIDPHNAPNESLASEDILRALQENGVVYGIDEKKVHAALEKWRVQQRTFEIDNVAKGAPPTPGREGSMEMTVLHVPNAAQCAEIKKATHYWQVADSIGDAERVDADTVIAQRQIDLPPVPGKTVTGELLQGAEIVKSACALGPNVRMSPDGRSIIATKTGIAYCVDGDIGVLPVNFDGAVELVVAGDRSRAHIVAHPPGPGGAFPSAQNIKDLLTSNKIIFGIRENALRDLAETLGRGDLPAEPVVIAESRPARDGVDGRVEFLFDTDYSLKPKRNADGSVDFKSLSIVRSVAQGAELARLIAPTKGEPGEDIFGNPIPAKDGLAMRLPAGANTGVHPQKPDVLIATTDGNIRFDGKIVEVTEGFVVGNDIDFSTGNITYSKSVIVRGDVKSGFSIDCGGDLEVHGTIEDCAITVGGNVLGKHGFLGQGKGVIDAKGNVNIGFLKNQTIRSHKCVSIAKEALNATIYARESIAVHGKPLSVAGGMLVARDSIEVYTVGNASQIKTILEVGIDYVLVNDLTETERHIAEATVNLRKLEESEKKFGAILSMNKKLAPKEEFLHRKLQNAIGRYRQQLAELENRKKIIQEKMFNLDQAVIKIAHAALPGTVFKIGDRHFPVREEIIGPKNIRSIKAQIRIL